MNRVLHAVSRRILDNHWSMPRTEFEYLLCVYERTLEAREVSMAWSRLSGESFKDIGQRWGVSGSRVRQIYMKTARKLKYRAAERVDPDPGPQPKVPVSFLLVGIDQLLEGAQQ